MRFLKGISVIEYKVVFKGEITNESNREKIEAALAKFFKLPIEKASLLFNGKSYLLKHGLTQSQAETIQAKFKAIGIVTYLIKEEKIIEDISSQIAVEPDANASSSQAAEPEDKKQAYWDEKFRVALQIERGEYPEGLGDKCKLWWQNFNFYAWLFGPLYLLYKRAWAVFFQYISIFALFSLLLFTRYDAVGKEWPVFIYFTFPLLLGHYFNRLYYYSKNISKHPEHPNAKAAKPIVLAVMTTVCFSIAWYGTNKTFFPEELAGVWYSPKLGQEITFDMTKRQVILGNSMVYKVRYMTNSLLKSKLFLHTKLANGHQDNQQMWKVSRIDESFGGDFTIEIEIFGETLDDVEFVREL